MSEKRTEEKLSQLLQQFHAENIYFSPNENPCLKKIFQYASKSGNTFGIPDRIYFDQSNRILIVFKCKKTSLIEAQADLKIYDKKMQSESVENYQIFYVAVVKSAYEIFDRNFSKIEKTLCPNTFGIDIATSKYTNEILEKDLHKIHNYIRDYTKISNEDKSFFIACILISLKKESFYEIIKAYNTKSYIYDLIQQNLVDFDIDISVFEFLRNDENNIHFLNLINMIREIYEKNPTEDLLNRFYSEFIRYGKFGFEEPGNCTNAEPYSTPNDPNVGYS